MQYETSVDIDLDDIASSLAHNPDLARDNYRGLLDFIEDVDDYVCDAEFTRALYARIGKLVAMEDE